MDIKKYLFDKAYEIGIQLDRTEIDKLIKYKDFLVEYNKKVNLTAIKEEKDVIVKHFVDSLTVAKYIDKNKKIIDIGTGGGFPGAVLKIVRNDLDVTLLDSVNKKIVFLEKLSQKLGIEDMKMIHSRVEAIARDKQKRESFDYTISRAVAPLNVLVEYHIPLLKVGGIMIIMKAQADEEIEKSQKAMKILGCKIEKIDKFKIQFKNEELDRTIILIKKSKKTEDKYPRKEGIPKKSPL